MASGYCSGLLGRTPLRPESIYFGTRNAFILFRPSRPDSIETSRAVASRSRHHPHCSGLLGRTPLRPETTPATETRASTIVPAF